MVGIGTRPGAADLRDRDLVRNTSGLRLGYFGLIAGLFETAHKIREVAPHRRANIRIGTLDSYADLTGTFAHTDLDP